MAPLPTLDSFPSPRAAAEQGTGSHSSRDDFTLSPATLDGNGDILGLGPVALHPSFTLGLPRRV